MGTFHLDLVRDYLIQVGCKVEYPILVNAFKKHLYNPDPDIQRKVRTQFKDCVNRLSTVTIENNMKYITLRDEFRPTIHPEEYPQKRPSPPLRQKNMTHQVKQAPVKPPATNPPKPPTSQSHQFSSNVIAKPSNPPNQPIEQSNSMTSIQQTASYQHTRDHPDSPRSLQPMDTLRRRWFIEACNCNFNNLLKLLRDDPKLTLCKDIINGYTAIHWAAKFGNIDIIKLIATTNRHSFNMKSSAGHTPLHVAYIFNRMDVVGLLLDIYQANPNVRDHAGKKPSQYRQMPNANNYPRENT